MKRKTFVKMVFILSFAPIATGMASDLLGDKRPPEVPPDAEIEYMENTSNWEDVVIKLNNVQLERIHPAAAQAGQEITVTLQATNLGDDTVVLKMEDPQVPEVVYPDPKPPSHKKFQHIEVPYYAWQLSVSPGSTAERIYHIRRDAPGIVAFSVATASDSYGNVFESKPTTLKVSCVPNGSCEPNENWINCPEDCEPGLGDGRCDGNDDGTCDEDCRASADPDCSDNDGDDFPDGFDNCPRLANDQKDEDMDGLGDACDRCLATQMPEGVPYDTLGGNRFALMDADGSFDTISRQGKDTTIFTLQDTGGCSCEQILDALRASTGKTYDGHYKFGCSKSVLEGWIAEQ